MQNKACYCGSGLAYTQCCEPLHLLKVSADTPEELMRSRYSAYACGDYQYILDTYSESSKPKLSAQALERDMQDTKWLGLEVINSNEKAQTVEFIAKYIEYSSAGGGVKIYQMHELSSFERENGVWRYVSGRMLDRSGQVKIGRNDTCPCGSAKKFKRCCASTAPL